MFHATDDEKTVTACNKKECFIKLTKNMYVMHRQF